VKAAFAAVAMTACMPKYFRDVPPSFVSVDQPVAKITAPPDRATLVFTGPIEARGPSKARTIVLGDGTALGQIMPMAWVAVDVPAGEQTVLTGVPEHGFLDECSAATFRLEAGKVYLFDGVTDPAILARTISLTSRLRVDAQRAQAEVRAQWAGYWAPCLGRGRPEVAARVAYDEITIPQPP
jgi:hypothetical protein